VQKGFKPEYLLGLDFVTKRFMVQSMIVAMREEKQRWGI
jgi:hypothetical protein